MPDIKRSYQIAMALRRLPLVHRPLKWLRRSAWQQVVDLTVETARVLAPMNPQLGPPKGTFSIYEALRRGEPGLEGRILLEEQSGQVVPGKSLQVLCRLKQHLEQPRPVFWSRHGGARLVTSSLALLNEKKQVAVESVYGRQFLRYQPGYRYLKLPRPTHLPGNWTSVVSSWVPTNGVPPFSHWLLDALPRLATLEEFPADTKIIIPKVLAPYQKETLALLGLTERIRYTEEEHLTVENYYFSSPTTMISCYNPYGINFLRTTFLPRADASYSGPKRFIIQRKGKSRGIKNEAEVNKFFQERGWGIIDTEKLTFAQEVKLFSQAEAIAGILGSGFTNAVWCSPGCVVITFVADSWLDGWVEWIAGVCNLPYHYQIFPSDHAMMAQVDVNEVGKLLKAAGLE
jgi:capsular polysaccharide biosynthesis protein